MFSNIENLEIIASFHTHGPREKKVLGKKNHRLILRSKGEVLYDFGEKQILCGEGDVILIPSEYPCTITCLSGENFYTSVNFSASFSEPLFPVRFSLDGFQESEYFFMYFSDLWNFGGAAERYRCFSLLYSLFAHLSKKENEGREDEKLKKIDPAISYLKENLYNRDLKTDRLHHLCGLSDTYFRQLFRLRFGQTPHSYILSKRLSHAKSILASGDYDTVEEVALSVGFNDPLYFSKAFKKVYGISPSRVVW
jgi:AraC-like DNA-binding protein